MKALSIQQPWAWAILHAGKDVENRTWYTHHRGEIAIHAPAQCQSTAGLPRGVPRPPPAQLTTSAMVGVAELVDVVRRSRSRWFCGPFGFVLANARPLPRPIPCRGNLMLWDVPLAIERRIREQLDRPAHPAKPSRFFTHYWTLAAAKTETPGTPLRHAAGAKFTERGVRTGDIVYVLTLDSGRLILLGKMQVGDIVFSDAEAWRRLGFESWPAPEHLLAAASTPIQWVEIPAALAKSLEFVSGTGTKRLKFESVRRVDRQTLRGCRELVPASAALLDRYLPSLERTSR
jgi:hypothetical protein